MHLIALYKFYFLLINYFKWVLIIKNNYTFDVFLTGVSIDKVLYAWLAVLILPINSALNPILYTLTTKLFRQRMARFVFRWKSTNRYRLRRHYDNHDRERHGQIGHPPQEGGAIDGEETTNGDGNQILILVRGSTYRRNWVSNLNFDQINKEFCLASDLNEERLGRLTLICQHSSINNYYHCIIILLIIKENK